MELLSFLYNKGFNVVAITDHQKRTIPFTIECPDDFIFIDGIEWWHPYLGLELVSLGLSNDNPMLKDATVSWIAHPYFLLKEFGYTIGGIKKVLLMNKDIYGLELYNNGVKQLSAEDIDYLSDIQTNYYAVDDFHIPSQVKQGWIEMEVDSLDDKTVLENLKSGNYWLRTG
jgi:hypothetical protein